VARDFDEDPARIQKPRPACFFVRPRKPVASCVPIRLACVAERAGVRSISSIFTSFPYTTRDRAPENKKPNSVTSVSLWLKLSFVVQPIVS